jgi:hypothetical protein
VGRVTPETELMLAANSFALHPGEEARERLRRAAIAAEGKVEGLHEQLRIAAARVAGAPRHHWPVARDALQELLGAIGRETATSPAPATQPIICPHCNELSRPGRVCDVCGEEMKAEAAA